MSLLGYRSLSEGAINYRSGDNYKVARWLKSLHGWWLTKVETVGSSKWLVGSLTDYLQVSAFLTAFVILGKESCASGQFQELSEI